MILSKHFQTSENFNIEGNSIQTKPNMSYFDHSEMTMKRNFLSEFEMKMFDHVLDYPKENNVLWYFYEGILRRHSRFPNSYNIPFRLYSQSSDPIDSQLVRYLWTWWKFFCGSLKGPGELVGCWLSTLKQYLKKFRGTWCLLHRYRYLDVRFASKSWE